MNSSSESDAGSTGPSFARSRSSSWVEKGSASISIDSTSRPLGWRRGAIAATRPVTGLWSAIETKPPGAATSCPRITRSPGRTTGRAGAPVCCESGRT